ncbi:MFS transporter [bacterium]|nr:MFS transporter [bacterium]MBU1989130.1 MFS transporter [bacterium]
MHKIAKLTKLTLLLIAMTTMMSNVAIITTLPHLKEYFLDTKNIEFLSRLMITLPSLSIAFLAPFLGHLIHKAGRHKSAVSALFFFALTGSAGLYLESLELILFSRLLLGITIAVLMIVSTSLVGDYFQGEARHKFMGVQSAFISLGGVFFVVGGGILSDIHWRYAFGIYLIGFLLIPFALKFLDEKTKPVQDESEVDFNSNLMGVYLLAFLLMLVFYILPTQMPFLIINHFGASSTMAGGIIALAFLSNGLGALMFSKLKNRFSFQVVYLIGMAIIAVGFILIGLVRDVEMFFLTSPIMGFGGGILMTNISAWMLSRAHHTKRVKSSGYLTSSLFLGQFFSPIVFHPVVSYFGVQDFFIVVGIFLAFVLGSILIKNKMNKI